MLSYLEPKADYKVKIKVKGIESLLNKSFIGLTEGFQYVIVESSTQKISEMEKILIDNENLFENSKKNRFFLQYEKEKIFYKRRLYRGSLTLEENKKNIENFKSILDSSIYSNNILLPMDKMGQNLHIYKYKYIDGKDLFEYFYKIKDENPIIRIDKSIPIFIKILEILNFINKEGFLWTDIKLENFMITKNEDVVAIDLDEIQKKGNTSKLLLHSYNYFNKNYLSEKYMLHCFIFMFINVISGFNLEYLASNPNNIKFFRQHALKKILSLNLNQEGKNKLKLISLFTNYLLEIFENNSESIDFSEIKLKLDELKLYKLEYIEKIILFFRKCSQNIKLTSDKIIDEEKFLFKQNEKILVLFDKILNKCETNSYTGFYKVLLAFFEERIDIKFDKDSNITLTLINTIKENKENSIEYKDLKIFIEFLIKINEEKEKIFQKLIIDNKENRRDLLFEEEDISKKIFIINNNSSYKEIFDNKEAFNFLGHGSLFNNKYSKKVIDNKKGFFAKIKNNIKEFINKAIDKTSDILKSLKKDKLEDKFEKLKKKIKLENLEFVEDEDFNLSSKEEEEVIYRMTDNMAIFLDMIMKNKGNEKKLDLLAEVFCHENLEILSGDHKFAAEHAGEFQKFLIELFKDKDFNEAFKALKAMNNDKGLNFKNMDIDKINKNVMIIVDKFNQNKSGLRILARDIYDEFQNIKKEMIKNVTKSETYREIVLDINGMNLDAIKDKINALGLENKYKLRVVLVGDIKEKEKLENYLKMLKDINNPFIDIEAVLGKELLVEIRNDAKLLDKYKNIVSAVTILGNGYILTASGNINESLYAEISKKLTEKNITINEKNIARSINAGFFGEKDFESIYKNFIEKVDNKKLANNVRQFVIGMEKELSKESLELLDCMVNKGNDNKNLNMIEVSENGLVVSREIEIDKFRENDLMNNEKVINVTSNEKILGTEKMVLEGIEGKNIDILRFGIIIKAKSIRLLSKIGLSKAIDGEKIKLSENVKSFASAA